jgi:hypothetical protein
MSEDTLKVYCYTVRETSSRLVYVKAASMTEAKEKIQEQYDKENIVLDWSDHDDTEIVYEDTIVGKENIAKVENSVNVLKT